MSELRENVFEMLDNDDNLIKQNEEENEKDNNNNNNNKDNKLNIDIDRKDYNDNDNHNNNENNNNEEEEDNSTWTDVSSSKVKKISSSSSSSSITKSDNKDNNERGKSSPAVSNKSNNNNNNSGSNSNNSTNNNNNNNINTNNTNNSVTSTNDNQTGSQEPTKKKVLRFTRDELLALHRPTKCLAEMVDIPEVVTVESLEPECNKPFDPDEILKIWNNDANKARESNGGRGRGRGRGRNGDGDDNTYSNHHKDDDAQDIWDDVDSANSKTFDLADFSAATFKFSESAIKLTENTELYSKEGDETMESLMKDDHDFSGSLEEEPTQPVLKSGNEKGRNLLLQTLAVKTSTTDPKSPAIPFKATVQASTDDTLLDELIEEDGVNLSTINGDLKNDDSLTFDSADDLDIDGIIGGLTATISATTISTTSTNAAPVQNAPIVPNQGAPTAINRVLNPQTQQVNQAAYIQQQQQAQVQAQQNILLYNQQPGSQIPRQPVPSPARPQQNMIPPSQQQQQQPVIVPVVPQPPPTLVPDKWIYRDPHGNIQGPFEMTAMRRWLESGYFKENLPIKMTRWTTFHPLGIVYPNPESAFLGLIHEPMLPNNPVVIHSIPPQMIPQQQQHMMQGIPQQQQQQQQQQPTQQQQQQMSRTVEITPKQIDSDRLQSNDQGLNADDLIKGKRAIPKSAPSTLVVTTPLDKQDTTNSNNSQIAAAVAAGSLTSNNSSSSTGAVGAGASSTNTTQQKTTKKVETTSTTNVSTTTSKDSQNSNNDPSKQKPKQQSQPSQQSQSQQQQQQPQQSKPNIVTSTTASTNSSVTSESNNGDNNNKKNDSQNANKKTKTTKKSSKDNADGSDSSNNKKNDESSQPVQSAWTNKKGRDANEGKALSLTEIQQQEEAAKKQHAGESHPVENPPSSVRSFQLKNLLGVGGKEKGWSTNSPSNNNQSSNSLRDIQNEQEKINESKIAQQQQHHQQQQQQQQQGRGSSQWKAPAGVSNNSGMKSLVEIMEEEKNASGSTQSETKAGRTGSWAAKAGGPKSSTESSSIPPNWIATQSQKNNELSISDNSDSKIPPSPGKRVVTVTNNTSNSNTSNIIKPNSSSSSQSQSQQQQQSQNNNNNNNNSKKSNSNSNSNSSNNSNSNSLAVGGDGIVEWSLLQLKRLSIENKSSTEDMALIEFCLTLKSAVEIREYLADYLGSTPQVSQFATEFIRRKEGKQPTQLRSTAGGTALTATILEKDKKNISLPTEAKKKKQKGKGQEF